MKRWLALSSVILVIIALTMWAGRTVYTPVNPFQMEYEPWPEEVVKNFAELPVHNGDRIKPLSTYAKVMLVKFHGDRAIKFKDNEGKKVKVGPEVFMLDALFRPNLSTQYPIFEVTNEEVLQAVGMETKKASDYYSYQALTDYRVKLFERGAEIEEKKKNDVELTSVESMTLDLARNIRQYELLLVHFSFARAGVVLPDLDDPTSNKTTMFATSTFMTTIDEIRKLVRKSQEDGKQMPEHLIPVLEQIIAHSNDGKYGPILISPNSDDLHWTSVGDALMQIFEGKDPSPATTLTKVRQLENLYKAHVREDQNFSAELSKTVTLLQADLTPKELKGFNREVTYNRASWFFAATFFCFLPGMILIAISWLTPASHIGRFLSGITWLLTLSGLTLAVIGVTQRSLIMMRPPVGNLYDTIIFIAAGVVFIALFTELVTRRKLALGIAPFIGFFLLALAHLYDIDSKADNMEPLIAVLRSNFWLTVHVPVITMGYAAGLVAWIFGAVYVFVRAFGLHKDDPSLRRLIGRMTYGAVCFCLLLSLVGTVTGGIWANDSWGRFWGWDPKENGALMIVLWTLFMLHARAGGIIKEWGLHICAIITGPIVVFSWWHTNLLGIGLHSYGFSDSKQDAVLIYYGINVIILTVGLITAAIQTKKFTPKPAQKNAVTTDS